MIIVFTVQNFPCSSCHEVFADKATIQKHMKSEHVGQSKKWKLVCTECKESRIEICWKWSTQQSHENSNNTVAVFICEKSFGISSGSPDHEIRIHTKKIFSCFCEICKKGFVEHKGLNENVKNLH